MPMIHDKQTTRLILCACGSLLPILPSNPCPVNLVPYYVKYTNKVYREEFKTVLKTAPGFLPLPILVQEVSMGLW